MQRWCYRAPHADHPCAFLAFDDAHRRLRLDGRRAHGDRRSEHLDLDRRDGLRARRDDVVYLSRHQQSGRGDVPGRWERLRGVHGARRRHLRLPDGAQRRVLSGRRPLLLLRQGLRAGSGLLAGSEDRRAHCLCLRRRRLRRRVQDGVRGRRNRGGLRALRDEGWNGPVQDSISGVRRNLSPIARERDVPQRAPSCPSIKAPSTPPRGKLSTSSFSASTPESTILMAAASRLEYGCAMIRLMPIALR